MPIIRSTALLTRAVCTLTCLAAIRTAAAQADHRAATRSAVARASHAAAMGFDVTEASIAELQEAMAAGRTSAAQLVDAYLARIAAYDHAGPELNALIRLNPRARAEAARLDAERREGRVRGPLHGIPIILKDNYDTDDLPTTGGSLALATHRPRRDAFVVARLRAAGAIVLAKANLHELAAGITSISSLGGQTRNPYDPARCPGGSSGGTGAAIAASFAALGWGTDTCGSIRIPSAFGALVGLRPTQGLFSRAGIVPLSHTQDTPGPLARTVRDLAIGLDATVGPDPDDDATRASEGIPTPAFVAALRADALAGTRVGVFAPYFRDAEPDVADTIRAALGAMQRLGATLVEVAMPEFDADIARTSLTRLETKHDLQDYLARPGGAPVRSLSDILAGGLYDKALEARHREEDTVTVRDGPSQQLVRSRQLALRARIVALMDSLHLDALAYPTSTRKPVLIGDPQLGTTCALAANTGLPAISVPAGFTDDGLPTGVELLGRPFSDARLVGFAFALEQAAPRRRPPPTTPPLVAGRAPDATRGTVVVAGAGTTAHADFTFEPTSGALRFGARLDAGAAEALEAVVLRRRDARGERVIARLLGPGMRSARGVVRVTGIDRDALEDGRVSLALYTRASVAAAGERPLRLGSARAAR